MLLPVPIPTVDPGPDWANNLYNCLYSVVDAHDHSSNSGVQVTPSGLNINSDLTFQNNNATNLRSDRYTPQSAPLALPTDLNCVYVSGVDLWYNDGNGNQIKLTSGGLVNATSSGISSGTATASFVSGTLVVDSNTNTPADIKAGHYLMGDDTTDGFFVTIQPPTLTGSYDLTLPAIPGSAAVLQIDTSGNITANNNLPGTITIQSGSSLSSSSLIIGAAGPTLTANGTTLVLPNGVQPGTSAGATLIGESSDTLGIANSLGTTSFPIVVSASPSTSGLKIVRGGVTATGSISGGEGFSVTAGPTGQFNITFSPGFVGGDHPIVVANVNQSSAGYCTTTSSGSTATIYVWNSSGSAANIAFTFIAIGQRSA
jgi:hypothetical protein